MRNLARHNFQVGKILIVQLSVLTINNNNIFLIFEVARHDLTWLKITNIVENKPGF